MKTDGDWHDAVTSQGMPGATGAGGGRQEGHPASSQLLVLTEDSVRLPSKISHPGPSPSQRTMATSPKSLRASVTTETSSSSFFDLEMLSLVVSASRSVNGGSRCC